MKKVYINGVLTPCQSGRGGATKDEIIAELRRRKLDYNKSALKGELCAILTKDDSEGKSKETPKSPNVTKEKKISSSSLKFPIQLKTKLANIFDSPEQLLINTIKDHLYLDVDSKKIIKESKIDIDIEDYDLKSSEVIPGNRVLEVYVPSQHLIQNLYKQVQEGKAEKKIAKIVIYDMNTNKYTSETGAYLRREWEGEDERWWDEKIVLAKYIGNNQVLILTSKMYGQMIWDFSENTLIRFDTEDDMDTKDVIVHPLDSRVLMYERLGYVIFVYLDERLPVAKGDKKDSYTLKTKKIKYEGEGSLNVGDYFFKISGNRILLVGTGVGLFEFPNPDDITDYRYTEIVGIWAGRGTFGPEVNERGIIKNINTDNFDGVYELEYGVILLKTQKRHMFILHLDFPEGDRLTPVVSNEGYVVTKDREYKIANLSRHQLIAWYHPFFFLDKIKRNVIFISYRQFYEIDIAKGKYVDIKEIEGSIPISGYVADMLTINNTESFLEAITILENHLIKNGHLSKRMTNVVIKFLI